MSYGDQLRRIANDFMEERGEPSAALEIAHWAIAEGLWQPQPADLAHQLASQIARAMREEYYVDPQGRSVRAKHAARVTRDGEQLTLWSDGRTGSREHMVVAFQQRRQQIVGDCRQLKTDVDSFNERRPGSSWLRRSSASRRWLRPRGRRLGR